MDSDGERVEEMVTEAGGDKVEATKGCDNLIQKEVWNQRREGQWADGYSGGRDVVGVCR